MTTNANIAVALAVALLGTAIEARADHCQYVRGSIAETRISLDTEPARFLGTVTGVLNGAVTVTLLSGPPNVRSLDVFLTKSGDVSCSPTPSQTRSSWPVTVRWDRSRFENYALTHWLRSPRKRAPAQVS